MRTLRGTGSSRNMRYPIAKGSILYIYTLFFILAIKAEHICPASELRQQKNVATIQQAKILVFVMCSFLHHQQSMKTALQM